MENLESHGLNFRISFFRPGQSWNFGVGHGKAWKMMFIKTEYKINWVFFAKIIVKTNPKILEKSWKRSRKVMEFQKLKRVRTLLPHFDVICDERQEQALFPPFGHITVITLS